MSDAPDRLPEQPPQDDNNQPNTPTWTRAQLILAALGWVMMIVTLPVALGLPLPFTVVVVVNGLFLLGIVLGFWKMPERLTLPQWGRVAVFSVLGVSLSVLALYGAGVLLGWDTGKQAEVPNAVSLALEELLDGTSLETVSAETVGTVSVYGSQTMVSFSLPADDVATVAGNIDRGRWYTNESLIQITTYPGEKTSIEYGSCAPFLTDPPESSIVRCELALPGVNTSVVIDNDPRNPGEPKPTVDVTFAG